MNNIIKSIKEEFKIRKAIALLLLIAAGVFLVTNIESLYYTTKYFNGEKIGRISRISEYLHEDLEDGRNLPFHEIKHDEVITQEFTAKESKIRSIRLMFRNEKFYDTEGAVNVSLRDSEDNVLASNEFNTNKIRNMTYLIVSFVSDNEMMNTDALIQHKNQKAELDEGIELIKGARYKIVVECEGISDDDEMALAMIEQADGEDSIVTADGKEVEGKILFGFFTYAKLAYKIFAFFILVLLLTAVLVLMPWHKMNELINSKHKFKKGEKDLELILQKIVFFCTPAICFWLNYRINGKGVVTVIRRLFAVHGALNMLLCILLLMMLYAVLNSMRFSSVLSIFATSAIGIACYFLIIFRDAPLRAYDLMDIGTAAGVAGNYEYTVNKSLMWVVIIAVSLIALNISFRRFKGSSWKLRLSLLIIAALLGGGFNAILNNNKIAAKYDLQIKGFDQTKQYRQKGYMLAFAISFRDLKAQKPAGYSVEEAKKVAEGYASDEAVESAVVSEESPNVIAIMNEAFTDLEFLGEVNTNEDYMPFFHSLEENAVKGTLHVSVFGGGTANTEYEFLTGNSLAFLKNRTVYTSLIRDDIPSLAKTLKSQGYGGIEAFHPGKVDSYNRNNVYPYMGFEEYTSLEDMEDPAKIREFVSDEQCYDTIIEKHEAFREEDPESPFFLFNVTIQNHSGFAYNNGMVDAGIKVKDSALNYEETEQYLNLIKESDKAFEKLVEYYSDSDEPTVIVMFGDHMPRVEDEFYDEMTNRMPEDETGIQKSEKRYQTPFVIWANYDIEEEKDVDLGANMLAPYMLDKIGLRMTGYDKYLLDLHKTIPAISGLAYYDSEGNVYAMDSDNEGDLYLSEDILKYHYLQYNNMNKASERLEDFFALKGSSD